MHVASLGTHTSILQLLHVTLFRTDKCRSYRGTSLTRKRPPPPRDPRRALSICLQCTVGPYTYGCRGIRFFNSEVTLSTAPTSDTVTALLNPSPIPALRAYTKPGGGCGKSPPRDDVGAIAPKTMAPKIALLVGAAGGERPAF